MAVNYLQYIRSVQPGGWSESPELRFLVSGADPQVRRVIGEAILSDCRTRSKTLYLVDYTQGAVGAGGRLGDLPIRDAWTALSVCAVICWRWTLSLRSAGCEAFWPA